MCSGRGNWTSLQLGFPIRKSPDQSLVANFPGLIAGSYVLLRLLVPRHSPCALSSLSCYKDARVHCVVLKVRAALHLVLADPCTAGAVRGDGGPEVSVARSFRTQQCAWRTPSHRLEVPRAPGGPGFAVLTSSWSGADQIVDVP